MSISQGDPPKSAANNNSDATSTSEQQNSVSLTADTASSRRQNRLKALYLDSNFLESIPAEIADHESL